MTDLQHPELQERRAGSAAHINMEKQILVQDKRWFKVRIMPYRTQDNVIDGVMITPDITASKTLEAELRGTICSTHDPKNQ